MSVMVFLFTILFFILFHSTMSMIDYFWLSLFDDNVVDVDDDDDDRNIK